MSSSDDDIKLKVEDRFNEIVDQIQEILDAKPVVEVDRIEWIDRPIQLEGPRFAGNEYLDSEGNQVLQLANQLLSSQHQFLEVVLWREAFLTFLPQRIRLVPEAADLGIYCYSKYGIKHKTKRTRLQQLWESVSHEKDFGSYRYFPTAGFAFFDNVAEGQFLQLVVPWLASFSSTLKTMESKEFTAYLERWMFNFHRPITSTELKILIEISKEPTISQTELANLTKLRQPTVSRLLQNLAEKHLLRVVNFVDFPITGLNPLAISFFIPNLSHHYSLINTLQKIRYSQAIHDYDELVQAHFVIPTLRLRRFREWIKQLSTAWDIPQPKIRMLTERMRANNFGLYDTQKGSWPTNFESILDNVGRLIKEEWTEHLPPINYFQYSQFPTKRVVKLQPEDFVYLQRATDIFLLTERISSSEAQEARIAGYGETQHMSYRRRIDILEKEGILSPAMGIGLFNIGLNTAIRILIEGSYEQTKRILTSFQLLPYITGRVYSDGAAEAVLLVPDEPAIVIANIINEILEEVNLKAVLSIRPAWQAYGWTGFQDLSDNYNFEKQNWIWTKDTLPIVKSPI
jgi:hypothetical protein